MAAKTERPAVRFDEEWLAVPIQNGAQPEFSRVAHGPAATADLLRDAGNLFLQRHQAVKAARQRRWSGPTLLLVFDEPEVLFTDPDYGATIQEIAKHLLRYGRHLGIWTTARQDRWFHGVDPLARACLMASVAEIGTR